MTAITHTTTADAVAAFESQGKIQPGTPGYWRVWGAQVRHVRAGDLVVSPFDGDVRYDLVVDTFAAQAAPLAYGFIDDRAERFTLGALCRVVVLRWGTENTLAAR